MEKEKLMEEISSCYWLVYEYKKTKAFYEEKLKNLAFSLLEELKKIDGWKIMMESCQWHYDQCPDEFFSWCEPIVYGSTEKLCLWFKKSYSNGVDCTVLRIDLTRPLEEQVKEKVDEFENKRQEEETINKEKEYKEYLRLKKKFE